MSIALQRSSLQRIAWKENYLLRPIVIANLVLFLLILLLICATVEPSKTQFAGEYIVNLFILFGCVVGLATGIVLFVPERETETDLLLGRMPVHGKQVCQRKIRQGAFWFALFIVMTAILSVGIFALRYGTSLFQLRNYTYLYFVMAIVIPIECFLWSVVCSMKFRKSIIAVIVAAVACVLGLMLFGPFVVATVSYILHTRFLLQQTENAVYLFSQAVLILVLATIAWRSSRTWLRGHVESKSETVGAVPTVASNVAPIASPQVGFRPSRPYTSLLWQSFRMQRIPVAILAVATPVIGAFIGWYLWVSTSERYGFRFEIAYGIFASVNFLWVLLGAGTGMLTFTGDQSNQSFLFFQQQTDYSRKVWLSRIATIGWMLPVALVAAIVAYVPMFVGLSTLNASFYGRDPTEDYETLELIRSACSISSVFWIFLLSAAAAQLITILIRWSVVAFFVVAIVSMTLLTYCNYLSLLGEPLWLFTGPISAICFAASWWFAPRWIEQRKVKRSMAVCSILAIGTIVVSFVGLIWHRATEFDEPYRMDNYAVTFEDYGSRLNSIETKYEAVGKLKEAFSQLKSAEDIATEKEIKDSNSRRDFRIGVVATWPDEFLARYIEANRKSIGLIQDAVADPDSVHFLNPSSSMERNAQASTIAFALEANAKFQLKNGTLEQSLAAIVAETKARWHTGDGSFWNLRGTIFKFADWAQRSDQTAESIRDGMAALESLQQSIFDRDSDRVIRERYYAIERYYGDTDPRESVQLMKNPPSQASWFGLTSWELQRSRRQVLNDLSNAITDWPTICNTAKQSPHKAIYLASRGYGTSIYTDRSTIGDWISPLAFTRPVLNAFRYTQVRMALEGYRLENESYPETLQDLVGDDANAWLVQLPCDVASGQPFAYSKNGLDDRVFFSRVAQFHVNGWIRERYTRQFEATNSLEANTPFLLPWSGLPVEKKEFTMVIQPKDAGEDWDPYDTPKSTLSGYWIPAPTVPRGEMSTTPIGDVESWKLQSE